MKDCFYQYRKGLYQKLQGITYKGVTVPVFEFAKADQKTPFIQILGMNSTYERDDDKFLQSVTTDIMVVTSQPGDPGDFGSMQSDEIMNEVMERLITKGVTKSDRAAHIKMDDFIDNGCFFVNLSYDNEFDGANTYIRKILTINTLIEEV